MGRAAPQPADQLHHPSDFVGRRQELQEVKRLLETARLVTLMGPGGVGKTRLALRVGADLASAFPDGVRLAQLSELDDPELVAAAVRDALGILDLSPTPPVEVLVEHLHQARLLLVLDNCEQVLPGCQEVVDAVLRACAGVRVLATSRHRLGTAGEHLFEVRPLPVPSGELTSLDSVVASPAVQLFANRAAMVWPGFTVDETNAEAVAEVCRRTEGIPLAVVLAAVRLRALSPAQLLEALEDRFSVLTKGYATAPERQRSLRAMVDWSFELCTDAERSLWARSTVFAGGFDLQAAAEVCSGQDLSPDGTLDLVRDLVDKSILQREEDDRPEVRFRMLDTLRDYGLEVLEQRDERAYWASRHREWCRQLVHRAADESFGPEELAWARRLRAEQGNLRAAMASSLVGPEEADVGLEIAAALRFYWFTSALLTEGRRWLHLLLERAPRETSSRVAALEVAGYLAVLQGEPDAARPLLDDARALGERLQDRPGLVRVSYAQGLLLMLTGHPAEAVPLFQESLELQAASDDRPSVMGALTCTHLSIMASVSGDLEDGVRWCERSLAMSEAADEVWCKAFALWASGIAHLRRGDAERAAEDERESLLLNQEYGDKVHGALAIEALAWVAAAGGAHHRAVRLLGGLDHAWHDMGAALFAHVSVLHEECVADCRKALGSDRFDRAFSQGRRLSFDDLVGLAFGEGHDDVAEQAPPGRLLDDSPLTAREVEVADLVASGKSNREIAQSLVISRRTAETHVQHILAKLGLTSRTQIVAWAAERKPSVS